MVSVNLATMPSQTAQHHGMPTAAEVTRQQMSWDEFLTLQGQAKAEWVNGEAIFMMAPASRTHNRTAKRLEQLFENSLPNLEALRDVGTLLAGRARVPDLVVIAGDGEDDNWLTEPPVVVVEIPSDSTRAIDLFDKADEYQQARVHHYWIVDPKTAELSIRENSPTGWQLIARVDADHPNAEVTVADFGTVGVRRNEIFDM